MPSADVDDIDVHAEERRRLEKRLLNDADQIVDSSPTSRPAKSAIQITHCCAQFVNSQKAEHADPRYVEGLGHAASHMHTLAYLLKSGSPSEQEIRKQSRDLATVMLTTGKEHGSAAGSYLASRLEGELSALSGSPTGDDLAREIDGDIRTERVEAALFGGGMAIVLATILVVAAYPMLVRQVPGPTTLGTAELLRLVWIIPLSVLAGYLGKETTARSGAARRLRGLRLQLVSLDNEALGSTSLDAGTYRRALYDRLYTAYIPPDSGSEAESKSVVEQLNETIQKVVDALPTSPK